MKHGPSFTQLLATQATSVLKIQNTFRRVLLEMLPHCTICQGIRYSSFLKPFFLLKGKHYEKNMNPAFASPVSQTNSLARFLEWPGCFFSGCLRHFFRRFVFVFLTSFDTNGFRLLLHSFIPGLFLWKSTLGDNFDFFSVIRDLLKPWQKRRLWEHLLA